jgi:hypothetical protein
VIVVREDLLEGDQPQVVRPERLGAGEERLLRATGLDVYLALLITSLVPAAVTLVQLKVSGRPGELASFMTVMMLLGAGISLIHGGERFLLAREALVTAAAGIGFLASARSQRPLTLVFARPLMESRFPRHGSGVSWDLLWARLPRFRRVWRVTTVLWGVGTLLDAVGRVAIAYTLPVDLVPALSTAFYAITSLVLMVITNVYFITVGFFDRRTRFYSPLDAQTTPAT